MEDLSARLKAGMAVTFSSSPKSTAEMVATLREIREKINVTQIRLADRKVTVTCNDIDVSFVLERTISAKIIKKENTEYLQITRGAKTGRVLRGENSLGLGAQTGSRETGRDFDQPNLIVELFPDQPKEIRYNHPFTDRGLCWVTPGNPTEVSMTLRNWSDPSVSPEELAGFILLAEKRVNEVIEAVLNTSISV